MIIVQLKGGMGNQMFQYAMGKSMALLNKTELRLDLSAYDDKLTNITPREYSLGCFNIDERFASSKEKEEIGVFSESNVRKLARLFLFKTFGVCGGNRIIEPRFTFCEKILKKNSADAYLEGYWTTEKYFKKIESIIRENFTLKNDFSIDSIELTKKMQTGNSVSLHIRRGDYANNPTVKKFHGSCSLEYYKKAISVICQKIVDPTFYVFSDDIKWVKENLQLENPVVYVSDGKLQDFEELTLMTHCKHNIIANSTFSWWGAWLNKNREKIVIAPKTWFANKKIDTSDVIPDDWIKI